MEKFYNKLVRDNIPRIIEENGEKSVIRVLNSKEYREELYKKLIEEVNEVINSKNKEQELEELADVLEVLKAISNLNGKHLQDIINKAEEKRLKRGGFEKRLFLKKTY